MIDRPRRAISACALSIAASSFACSARPPPPTITEAPSGGDGGASEVGPLVWLGPCDDRISPADGPVHPDGIRDFAFDVRISGPVIGLALHSSDLAGRPVGGEIWDTFTGPTYPKALGLPYAHGSDTAEMAVYAHGVLLDPNGVLPATTFDGSQTTIVVADTWGNFRSGRAFALLVLRPGGVVDRTTVVILDRS